MATDSLTGQIGYTIHMGRGVCPVDGYGHLTGQLGYIVHMGCGVCTVDGYGQSNRSTWLHCLYGLWGVHSGWLWEA